MSYYFLREKLPKNKFICSIKRFFSGTANIKNNLLKKKFFIPLFFTEEPQYGYSIPEYFYLPKFQYQPASLPKGGRGFCKRKKNTNPDFIHIFFKIHAVLLLSVSKEISVLKLYKKTGWHLSAIRFTFATLK
ncbi:hypothetical protein BH11BAC4_BH11BAC4_17750 [soil metagenome]